MIRRHTSQCQGKHACRTLSWTEEKTSPRKRWGQRGGLLLILLGVLLLGSCRQEETQEAMPVVPLDTEGRSIAEAMVEPARWSELRFESGGTVARTTGMLRRYREVLVQPGDTVQAGYVLARIDSTDAELEVQEAEAALTSAQARLALAKAGPRPEEITAAEEETAAASAALDRAIAQRDQLIGGATEAEIAAAQAELATAEATLQQVSEQHRQAYKQKDQQVREQADYDLRAAREAVTAAQSRLEALQRSAGARLRGAAAGVEAATAQVNVSQAQLALLKAATPPGEIASAEAEVQQAEAALAAAEVALERTSVRAPFDGTVTRVNVEVGNSVTPGEVVAVLATLDQLQLRTTDLTELDVVHLEVGQSVTVTVDAIPNTPWQGHIVRIDLRGVEYRGDVTYPVLIELDEVVPELYWGMTAMVEFETP